MLNETIIRRYKKEDYEIVWHLHERELKKSNAWFEEKALRDKYYADMIDIESHYLNGGEFVVLEHQGKIIGMGGFRDKGNHVAEIKRMRVKYQFQGMGFGTLILKHLEAEAVKMGFKKIILDTNTFPEFYERFDYKQYGTEMRGPLKMILYEKTLHE